jgi:hypothetical protein
MVTGVAPALGLERPQGRLPFAGGEVDLAMLATFDRLLNCIGDYSR